MSDLVAPSLPQLPVRAPSRRVLRSSLFRHPPATAGAVYAALLVVAASAATFIAPYDPQAQDLSHVLTGPSGTHWLGTDRLGRDVLSRLLYGARVTLLDVTIATVVFLLLGIPLGVAAGDNAGFVGSDAGVGLAREGWAGMALVQDASRYFDWHHTANDTLDKVDPAQLRQNVAAWAVTAWLAAQSPEAFGPIAKGSAGAE